MRRAVLIVVFLIAAGGLYFAYPFWTASRLIDAFAARDADTIDVLVDWPQMRESVRANINLSMMNKPGTKPASSAGAFGEMLGVSLVGRLVEAAVTPEGMRRLFADAAGPAPALEFNNARFVGFDAFRADLSRVGAPPPRVGVKMQLIGLRWRVTGLDIPPEILETGLPLAKTGTKGDRLIAR